jgi:phosphate transport system permease protein
MTTQQPTSPLRSLEKKPLEARSLFNFAMTTIAVLCLGLTLIPLVWLVIFVLARGVGRMNLALLTELPPAPGLTGGGLANALIGTLMVVTVAIVIAVPFGILAAIYLSEFSDGNRLARRARFATNILNGVPSIIAGVFVYGLLVRTGITGYSAVAGGVALAILMLPTIIRTADEALQLVPQDLRWAALGAGASRYQTVLRVVLPAAAPAILTGVTLAIARATGETAPLLFTALFSPFWPESFREPVASLAVLVYNFATVPFSPQQDLAWAGALILILLVLLTNLFARMIIRRQNY